MKLHLIYLCIIILVVFILTISISAIILKREGYVLHGEMGKTKNKKICTVKNQSSNKSKSIKYKGHRYERHHIRSNPHVRRYQDSF